MGDEIDTAVDNDIHARHRKEKRELQAKIQALKKTATKGDKKKKKDVQEEISKLESDLQLRHNEELRESESNQDKVAEICEEVENTTLESFDSVPNKQSKAQKRRDKKDQAAKERERRIVEQEVQNINSLRNVETKVIKEKLRKRDLMIYEIPSDGDCLFAAVDHGLKSIFNAPIGIKNLRLQTSKFIINHPNDYLPFLTDPKTGGPLSEEGLLDFCQKIATTTQWGGQVELGALANVIKKAIVVVQADGPELLMGENYINDGQVVLTYHRHMYHLGEHYNSVQKFVEEPDEL